MELRILIGVLLACVATGLPMEEKTHNDDMFTPMDYALFKDTVMYVYDDDEYLVKLILDDEDNDENIRDLADIESRIEYLLYTKDNPNDPSPLYVNDDNALKNSNFDPTKPTRFITHGWMNSHNSKACTMIRDAYIQHGDYNVIVIDWSSISIRPYIWASRRVPIIGQFVSTMIDFLQEHGMDLSQTIVIGHSLGAHVVGIAARYTEDEVNYVVGLDPALPGFHLAGPGYRISSGDGKYVEIIHTNGGLLGFLAAIGDVDFYPNGGQKQIGCLVDVGGACSHARSYMFFAESINSSLGFHGKKCGSFRRYKRGLCKNETTSIMGGHKNLFYARGNYYLTTKPKSPFANGPSARQL